MFKISQKSSVALWLALGGAAALVISGAVWSRWPTDSAVSMSTLQARSSPKWEFESKTDAITDEIYTNIHLYGESRLALLSIRCENIIKISEVMVPILTLQLATSDYLGKTELFETRSVIYRLAGETAVRQEWHYSDKNAEQDDPKSGAEALERVKLADEILDGTILTIRVSTYRYKTLDYVFTGRDTTDAKVKLLKECLVRTLAKNSKR